MSKVTISGNASGTGTLLIAAPNTNSDITLNLPTTMGTNNSSSVVTTDAAGNLGLGVTPSAWGSSSKAFELGLAGYAVAQVAGFGMTHSANAFYGASGWTYGLTNGASQYRLLTAGHAWFTAPSGTAGAAITFTQAMTLDASGQLQLNTTTADGQFHVSAGTLLSTSGAEDLAASFSTNDGNNTRLQIKAYRFSAGSDHTTDELKIQRRVDSSNQTYIGFRTDGRTDIGNGTTSYLTVINGTTRLNGGIQFNGDTATANALNDYEEGVFTPTIVGTTTAGTGTYSVQSGRYTKIGDRVIYMVYVVWSAHTGTGNMRISGLPFTSANVTSALCAAAVRPSDLTLTANNYPVAYVNTNSTQIILDQVATGGSTAAVVPMDTAASLMVSGHYEV